jgi:two-component system, NarL family, nitrate/nitrite sensor histidine kinase NarX
MGSEHILFEIAASLSAEPDLEALLTRFLGKIVELCGASAGAARVLADDGQSLRLVSAVGLPVDLLEREAHVALDCGICGDAARTDSVTEATDMAVCALRSSSAYFGGDCTGLLAVPLTHRGRTLGVYNVFLGRGHRLPPATLSLLHSVGELLGLALENARLSRASLRATLAQERQMMANEVHDSLAQGLYFMKMRMSLLAKAVAEHDEARSRKYVDDINQALAAAYASLRELLTHFRSRLDPEGLVPALAAIASGFHDKTGVTLAFENDAPALRLSVEQELQVFHIVNEALSNVSRHSGAKHARLVLAADGGYCDVAVEDDGRGIGLRSSDDPMEAREPEHLGLSIMRERARQIGGDVRVERRAGQGTRVRLRFPLETVKAKAA